MTAQCGSHEKTAVLPVQIGVSVGIAGAQDKLVRTSDVLKAADKAVYYARQHGWNRVVRYGGKM